MWVGTLTGRDRRKRDAGGSTQKGWLARSTSTNCFGYGRMDFGREGVDKTRQGDSHEGSPLAYPAFRTERGRGAEMLRSVRGLQFSSPITSERGNKEDLLLTTYSFVSKKGYVKTTCVRWQRRRALKRNKRGDNRGQLPKEDLGPALRAFRSRRTIKQPRAEDTKTPGGCRGEAVAPPSGRRSRWRKGA